MDWATIITVLVTSILVPYLAKLGVTLDPASKAAIISAGVTIPSTVVHFIETKIKTGKSAAAVIKT